MKTLRENVLFSFFVSVPKTFDDYFGISFSSILCFEFQGLQEQ